jgi:hypothetical protein
MTPEALPDPILVALDFASILDRLEAPYLVGGSLASSMHGEPRSTLDVDFVVDLPMAKVQSLVAALEPAYYVDVDTAREAVRTTTSFNAIHLESAVKVDVFPAGTDAFDQERLEHRLLAQVGREPPQSIFIDTPEHSILRKLEWYRRGGDQSDRQWKDVLSMLRVQGARLDRSRMALWAERLGVSDLLARAEAEG